MTEELENATCWECDRRGQDVAYCGCGIGMLILPVYDKDGEEANANE